MSARVSPTDRIRGEIDALFEGSRELSEIIEDVARLGARLIIQSAMEAEVDVHPGARAEPVLAAWGITTEGQPSRSAARREPELDSSLDRLMRDGTAIRSCPRSLRRASATPRAS